MQELIQYQNHRTLNSRISQTIIKTKPNKMIKERERIEEETAMYLIIISSLKKKKKNPNSLVERD